MTKHEEELMGKIEELENEIESLECELADAESALDEAQNEICSLESENEKLKNGILDLTNFKRELEMQNLMTRELDEFIENYMRFSNQGV